MHGLQKKLKTGALFLDLRAAYDTVWHKGLLVKMSKILLQWAVEAIALLISNRRFRVHMGDECSASKVQHSRLPKGSILALTLFNMYANNLPAIKSGKFNYADDQCYGAQALTVVDVEQILNEDAGITARTGD